MKNIEKYEHEISQLVNEGDDIECAIATAAGIVKENSCSTRKCKECRKECLEWMYSEYNEPILSDDEKDIIRSMTYVIKKIGCTVKNVTKYENGCDNEDYICVNYTNEITGYYGTMTTPLFKKNKFKGMEIGRNYSIEELGITCQQKDN